MTNGKDGLVEKLKVVFSEESQELLRTLEENMALLSNKDFIEDLKEPVINDIFRVMHTLKASVSTLGYENMSKFMHTTESFLDELKTKKKVLNEENTNILFEVTKYVNESVLTLLESNVDISIDRLQEILKPLSKSEAPAFIDQLSEAVQEFSDEDLNFFQIVLRLHRDLLKTGTDPVILINQLKEIGEFVEIRGSDIDVPPFEKLVLDELHLTWEIILKTPMNQAQVEDIFKFVKSKSDILVANVTERFTKDGADKLLQDKRIGEILVERGVVEPEAIEEALVKKEKLGDVLIKKNQAKAADINKALKDQEKARKNLPQTIRVDTHKLDLLVNLVGELVINESRLRNLAVEIQDPNLRREMTGKCDETARIINDLQENVMGTRMIPIDTVFMQFHRVVRDISLKQNKNIRLIVSGQESELDKNVVEKINSPLKHIVRNCVDHGVETADDREKIGKPREAVVGLKAYHKEGSFFIEVSDDGKGLDRDAILNKAIEKGIISHGEQVSDDFIYNLIFHPGFSTAKTVTDVSGRGVGMDVVRKAVSELHGRVDIHTEKGKGTTFTIRLPLTLAIIEGLLFKLGSQVYIIPLLSVDEIIRPDKKQVNTIEGKGEYIDVRGQVSSLVRLHRILDVSGAITDVSQSIVLNMKVDHRRYSLMVDDIIGQQQIVLKSLEDNFDKIKGLSGATILGDGNVATIVEPEELVDLYKNYSSVKNGGRHVRPEATEN